MTTKQRGSPVVSFGVYLIQIGLVLVLVLHSYGSKDVAIVISLLIAMFGMSTAQTAGESMVSTVHFLILMKRIGRSAVEDQAINAEIAEIEELTEKDTPYTFAHALFGFVLALIGAGKLVYVLFVA